MVGNSLDIHIPLDTLSADLDDPVEPSYSAFFEATVRMAEALCKGDTLGFIGLLPHTAGIRLEPMEIWPTKRNLGYFLSAGVSPIVPASDSNPIGDFGASLSDCAFSWLNRYSN